MIRKFHRDLANNDKKFFEKKALSEGCKLIAGVDEAGRGPLAGPLFVVALIFDPDTFIEGVDDSKKIPKKKRDLLFDKIYEKAKALSVVSISAKKIDELNILQGTLYAMRKALDKLSPSPDIALIDGSIESGWGGKEWVIVKGDSASFSISAASIVAKVSRDRYMENLDKLYPEYSFRQHKGYPTKDHIEAIKKYGPTPEHRLSFKPFARL